MGYWAWCNSWGMSIDGFIQMIQGLGAGCEGLGRGLAQHVGVPFYEDRRERMLGHCLREKVGVYRRRSLAEIDVSELLPTRQFRFKSGEVLCTNDWPSRLFEEENEQLTEEVWTYDHWPDSYNDVEGAVAKLSKGITGVYWHASSLNLVLLGAQGERVGIRSVDLMTPLRSRSGALSLLLTLKRHRPS